MAVFRTCYGPTHKAFAALDAGGQAALEADLLALLRESTAAAPPGWWWRESTLESTITR